MVKALENETNESITQVFNEVISNLMDRFVEEIVDKDELALQKQVLIAKFWSLGMRKKI